MSCFRVVRVRVRVLIVVVLVVYVLPVPVRLLRRVKAQHHFGSTWGENAELVGMYTPYLYTVPYRTVRYSTPKINDDDALVRPMRGARREFF